MNPATVVAPRHYAKSADLALRSCCRLAEIRVHMPAPRSSCAAGADGSSDLPGSLGGVCTERGRGGTSQALTPPPIQLRMSDTVRGRPL
jgi:hypothetical protein